MEPLEFRKRKTRNHCKWTERFQQSSPENGDAGRLELTTADGAAERDGGDVVVGGGEADCNDQSLVT